MGLVVSRLANNDLDRVTEVANKIKKTIDDGRWEVSDKRQPILFFLSFYLSCLCSHDDLFCCFVLEFAEMTTQSVHTVHFVRKIKWCLN